MLYLFLSIIFLNLYVYYGNYIFLVFLFICLYQIGKREGIRLLLFTSILLIIYSTSNINIYNYELKEKEINDIFEVEENKENYSLVSDGKYKYLIYNNDCEFYEGNKIKFKGYLRKIDVGYNSFYKYLDKQGVKYVIDYYECEMVDNNRKLNEIIVDKLLENKSVKSQAYLELILFNNKNEENIGMYNVFTIYSLTHLIAVSGFHINLLLSFFKKVFKSNIISYFGIVFYLYLLNFNISSYRALLCNIIKKINKKLDFDLSNIDILSLIGSVFIIINPYIMFSYGFIFSFLSAFVLEIFKLYDKKKIFLSFYIYLVNIPLILLNYYKLNIATLIFSFILSYPISFLYVFSFIYLFLLLFIICYC